MITLILVVFAFAFFVLASIAVPAGRYSLGWAGMACLALAWLIAHAGGA